MDKLIHLIYASTETPYSDRQARLALLKKARENNAELGLTGMLLYERGNFFQVLEGPESVVLPLFAKICSDKRHDKVTKIIQEPIARRSFGDWTMAFSEVSREELASIDGINDFFSGGSMFAELNGGRAKKLVAAFGAGRWRNKIAEDAQTGAK